MSIASNGIPTSHKADKQLKWMPKRCTAQKRGSNPPTRCVRAAEPGMNVCWAHGGRTKAAKDKAVERKSKDALMKLGVPVEKDPRDVLLRQVHYAHGMMEAASELAQQYGPLDLNSDNDDTRRHARAAMAIMGDWSDRAARVSKMALDAGIEERLVKLAENQSLVIVQIIRSTIDALNLTPEQHAFAMQVAAQQLRAYAPPEPVLIDVTPE